MGLRNFRKTKITGKRKPTEQQQQTDRHTHELGHAHNEHRDEFICTYKVARTTYNCTIHSVSVSLSLPLPRSANVCWSMF